MKVRYANGNSDISTHVAEPVIITMTEAEAKAFRQVTGYHKSQPIQVNELNRAMETLRENLGDYGLKNL